MKTAVWKILSLELACIKSGLVFKDKERVHLGIELNLFLSLINIHILCMCVQYHIVQFKCTLFLCITNVKKNTPLHVYNLTKRRQYM